MCVPSIELKLLNPTTQVALYSICIGNCSLLQNITWNIYQGQMNASANFTTWMLLNQSMVDENLWLFGSNTTNFTAIDQLFLHHPHISLWRFEVIYSFAFSPSSSALNFLLNQPPQNGSCSISPSNGTTSTLFTISCRNWFDDNGIKDHSLYHSSKSTLIAYSSVPIFEVRLPAGETPSFFVELFIQIRDNYACITKYNLSSVIVRPDLIEIKQFINQVEHSPSNLPNNTIARLLASENQNIVTQVMNSLSHQLNEMNIESIDRAVYLYGIPPTGIFISPLRSARLLEVTPLNQSALDQYKAEINSHASIREYLLSFIIPLAITTSDSLEVQAACLAQLTNATSELTRMTISIAFDRCYQLSLALKSMATIISYESVQMIVSQLIQCVLQLRTVRIH